MKNNKFIYILGIVAIFILGAMITGDITKKDKLENVSEVNEDENTTVDSNNSSSGNILQENMAKIKDSQVKLVLENEEIKPMMTLVEKHDNYKISLSKVTEGSEVWLMDPKRGERIVLEGDSAGNYIVSTSLNDDVNYGIMVNNRLIGTITQIEDIDKLNETDEAALYIDILKGIQCAL
ncbi:MAG: hypothetical protein RR620_01400 [Clostridium sp.]